MWLGQGGHLFSLKFFSEKAKHMGETWLRWGPIITRPYHYIVLFFLANTNPPLLYIFSSKMFHALAHCPGWEEVPCNKLNNTVMHFFAHTMYCRLLQMFMYNLSQIHTAVEHLQCKLLDINASPTTNFVIELLDCLFLDTVFALVKTVTPIILVLGRNLENKSCS